MSSIEEIVARPFPELTELDGTRFYDMCFESGPLAFMLESVEQAGGDEKAKNVLSDLLQKGLKFDVMWLDPWHSSAKQPPDFVAPIHIVSRLNSSAWIDVLANFNIDFDIKCGSRGMTPLFHALHGNSMDAFESLLKARANVSILRGEHSLMHEAASLGHVDFFGKLHGLGLDPDVLDAFTRQAPLHYAARANALESCVELVRLGANINLVDSHGLTPLLEAAYQGSREAALKLIDLGASVECRAPLDFSIFDMAEMHNHRELAAEMKAYIASRAAMRIIDMDPNDATGQTLRRL